MLYLVIGVIAVSVALMLIVILKKEIANLRSGKIIAFLGFFILPGLAAVTGVDHHLEESKSIDFCRSCHVMEPYIESLYIDDGKYIPANHFQNNRLPEDEACYSCHKEYVALGGVKAKIKAIRHLAIYYLGKTPEKIEMLKPYNNRECLQCHDGARTFEENPIHVAMITDIKSNDMSCLTCHQSIHNIEELESLELWKGGPQE